MNLNVCSIILELKRQIIENYLLISIIVKITFISYIEVSCVRQQYSNLHESTSEGTIGSWKYWIKELKWFGKLIGRTIKVMYWFIFQTLKTSNVWNMNQTSTTMVPSISVPKHLCSLNSNASDKHDLLIIWKYFISLQNKTVNHWV